MKKLIAGSLLAMGIGGAALPAAAEWGFFVNLPPPAPIYEVVPAPRAGYVWAPGHWHWHGHRHVWMRGHWVRERPGYVYAPARWVDHHGRYHYEAPRWSRHRDSDGDGIPDHHDRAPYNPRYR